MIYEARRESTIDNFKLESALIDESNISIAFSVCSVDELANYVSSGKKFFRLKEGISYRTSCIEDIESEIAEDASFQADLNFMIRTSKELDAIKEKLNDEIYRRAHAQISEIKNDWSDML